jgi:hypothetical protein
VCRGYVIAKFLFDSFLSLFSRPRALTYLF